MKTTLPLLTALLLTPIAGLRAVDPKPAQRSVVTDEPQRNVGKPERAAEYVVKAEPKDGQHLALTLKKLEHGFDPPRPFLIWALGSSYTNMLGSGEPWMQEIPKLFPNLRNTSRTREIGWKVIHARRKAASMSKP